MGKSRSMESQKLINEKTLQRYIYETIAYGEKEDVKKMYPKKFDEIFKKQIKVIIPEFPIKYIDNKGNERIHKSDFRIIFKDNEYVNIEVEWKTSRFNHGKEVYDIAYKENNGFLVVIKNDEGNEYIEKENIVEINAESFSFWFLRKSKHIIDGTISNYIEDYNSRSRKNWVVFLPSKGKNNGESLKDYKDKGLTKKKWAFRYSIKKPVMKNIFDIMAGDIVVFIHQMEYGENTKGRQIFVDKDWRFKGIDIVKVVNGYYCDFKDSTFECEQWENIEDDIEKISNKIYMHYFDFKHEIGAENNKLFPRFSKECLKSVPEWEEFVNQLRWSCNNEGAPAEISECALNFLISQLEL